MKKLISILITIVFITIFISSCNKDESTPTGGNTTNQGATTQTFKSRPNITIKSTDWTLDSLNANITFGINSQNVSNIKLNLDTLENINAQNLKFALVHRGIEVFVIDTLMPSSPSPGNMINTVLSDSSLAPNISNGNYPYTGVFRPSHPLSSFINSDASGYWTLRIYNSGTYRTGVIKSWGITLTYMPTLQVPTITRDYIPMINNNWSFRFCDTNITTGVTGENVTWNYSNIQPYPDEYTDEYVQPILSPQFWHFSQSNLGKRNFQLNGNFMQFGKSDLNAGILQSFGEADSSSSGLKMMKFVPPMTDLYGTFTYNSITRDSGSLFNVDLGTNHNGLYRHTNVGDGWGKIILPGGITYNNVLRTKNTIEMMDTISGSNLRFMNFQAYSWFAMGFKFPVFRITIYMEYNMGGPGVWEKKVYYTTQNVPINK